MRWCFFTFRVFAHSTVWLAERVTRCYLIYLHVCDGIETWTRWCVEQSSHSRSRSSFSVDLRRNILKAGVDSWLQSNYIRYQFSHEIRDLLTQSINCHTFRMQTHRGKMRKNQNNCINLLLGFYLFHTNDQYLIWFIY